MKEITVSTEFIEKANALMNKLFKDTDFKTRLLKKFNKDAEFIKESLVLCQNAQTAEDKYEKETKEAVQAKEEFEKKYKVAEFNYTKHTSFLKLLFKYNVKKQIALELVGKEEAKNKEEWFLHAMDVYDKIIGDSSAVKKLGEFNFKASDLKQGFQSVIDAHVANNTLVKENTEAKTAILNKDHAFSELYDRMQFIQLLCYYTLLDDPEKFKQLGLPIIDDETGSLINVRTKDMVKDASITKMKETPRTAGA